MAEDLDAAPVAPPAEPVVEPPTEPADLEPGDLVDAEKAKGLIAALKATREEAKAAKAQAAKVSGLEQQLAQAQPYVQFLQNNPQLMQQQQPRPQEPPPQPNQDPTLRAFAKELDYYDGQGNLNVDRAKSIQNLIQQEARKIATEIVGPLAQTTYNDAATRNWNQAITEKLPNGVAIDQNLLRAAWQEVARQNGALVADPRVVRVITNNVLLEQWRNSPLGVPSTPPPGPPVHTDAPGGGPPKPRVNMSDTERRIIGDRMNEKKYTELTKDFVPGRTNVLED